MTKLGRWTVLVLLLYTEHSSSLPPSSPSLMDETTLQSESQERQFSNDSYETYDHCFVDPNVPCIQKRLITFLERLSRVKVFSIVGDWVSVVKTNETSEEIIVNKSEARKESDNFGLFEKHFEKFLNNHVIRLSLPDGITAKVNGVGREFGSSIDVSLARAIGEARKKVKIKHMVNMMMSGLMSKAAMLGPLLMLIVKIKAFKALVLSTLALVLSKIQLFKMLMKGKGSSKEVIILHEPHGGGGGGHGGGGGGGHGGWSSSGGGGYSNGGGGHQDSYGPPNDGGGGHGGYGGGGSGGGGGWSNGGGGGYGGGGGGGGGSWASASGDSYSSADGGHGGGGSSGGGWGSGWASRKYEPTWLVYRSNKTTADTKQHNRQR